MPSPSTPPPAVPFPPPGSVFIGLNTDLGSYNFGAVDAFTDATGYAPSALQFNQGWAVNEFDAEVFHRIARRGMLPILGWEPWDYTARAGEQADQPAYRLSRIAGGAYDGYIRSWADGIRELPYRVVVRFAHEMNGFWYPWCEQSNGNRPGDYVKAWRHVHDIFSQAGASNVTWMWSPNIAYTGSTPLSRLYPGDRYVDWIGLSGYYGTSGHEAYRSFDQIFTGTLRRLAKFTRKPVVISETGATDAEGHKARWIRQMFAQLPRHPAIIGVVWFEVATRTDWRVAASRAAARAFAAGARQARYRVAWSMSSVPRTAVATAS